MLFRSKITVIREGYRTLEELGAIVTEAEAAASRESSVEESADSDVTAANAVATQPQKTGGRQPQGRAPARSEHSPQLQAGALTDIGRRMAALPVDPAIARIILAAVEMHSLPEVLAIAAFLECQDPRERPIEKQQAADEAHRKFFNRDSDFLTILNLWDAWHEKQRTMSNSQLRKWCQQHFLSWLRMREWVDVHGQLRELLEDSDEPAIQQAARALAKQRQHPEKPLAEQRHNDFAATHKALLTGLLPNIAMQTPEGEFAGAGGGKLALWPGSALAPKGAKWFVAAELVETTRRYARTIARIQPEWIEPLAGHLVSRDYFEPHWDPEAGNVMIYEKVSLWGLPIVTRRRTTLARIDPVKSREMLIQHGLVELGLLYGQVSDGSGPPPQDDYEDEEEALERGATRVRPRSQQASSRGKTGTSGGRQIGRAHV